VAAFDVDFVVVAAVWRRRASVDTQNKLFDMDSLAKQRNMMHVNKLNLVRQKQREL